LVDDTYEIDENGVVTNALSLNDPLNERDLGAVLTCQAVNNNLSIPISTSVRIDMTCE